MDGGIKEKIVGLLKKEGLTVKESLDALKDCKSHILSNLKIEEIADSDLEKATKRQLAPQVQPQGKFIPEDSNGKRYGDNEKMTFEEYCNRVGC